MADTSVFTEVGEGLVERLFSGILWFGIAFIIVVALVGVIYFFFVYKRKFDIKVKVISERADDKNKIIFDKAAILIDRETKVKYFKLWNLNLELTLPKFNVLQSSSEGDYLELYRPSEEELYFLTPSKIDKRFIIKSDGTKQPMALQEHKIIDTDISYWNVKRKASNKKMFDTESLLMKLLPYMPHMIGGVITIFVLYILMDTLPTILSELRTLVSELNSLKGASVKTGFLFLLTWKRKHGF